MREGLGDDDVSILAPDNYIKRVMKEVSYLLVYVKLSPGHR